MKSKKVISLIILICIALQVYAGVKFHQRSWPFVGYNMYCDSHRPGDKLEMLHIFGRTASGERLEIFPEDFGLWFWPFNNQVKPRLLNPRTRLSGASELLSLYNEKWGGSAEKLIGLEAVMEYRIVTRKGPPEIKFEALFVYNPEEQER